MTRIGARPPKVTAPERSPAAASATSTRQVLPEDLPPREPVRDVHLDDPLDRPEVLQRSDLDRPHTVADRDRGPPVPPGDLRAGLEIVRGGDRVGEVAVVRARVQHDDERGRGLHQIARPTASERARTRSM